MRYFLAFLVTFALILLLFLLLFHGGNNNKPNTGKALDSYSNSDAVARLTIDGPIVANQNYAAIRVTVGRDDVTFEQIQGYQGSVVNQQTYANNSDAYGNFLVALERAGFTSGNNSPSLKDERGYCPLGDRYTLEFIQEDKELEHYWATSCGKPKTYLGALGLTLTLFKAQVPDYAALSQNVAL
jgi:hypothetical protein